MRGGREYPCAPVPLNPPLYLARPGFNDHAAAEAAVLFAQGRAPANLSPGEFAHYQAEQAVLAAQQNLIVQG